MLIGEHITKLGEKNRVALPKKLRSEIGDKLIITKGYEDCLIVVSQSKWEVITKDLISKPFTSGSARDTSRFILGGAVDVELDDQGRFVIPQNLVSHADLDDSICFLGLINWVEIWSLGKWREREEYLKTNGSEIAEKLNVS